MRKTGLVAVLLAGGLLLGACSDDTKVTPPPGDVGVGEGKKDGPTGPGSDAKADAGPPMPIDCTGKTDGTDCASAGEVGLICLKGKCVTSSCGDLFVDAKNNEECDDGNTVTDDGCNACKWGCTTDPVCDDKEACNGTETCDLAPKGDAGVVPHKCKAGTNAADSTPCTLTGGGAGVCKAGGCVAAGCGNKVVDAGEDCDDGNSTAGDGCENNCKWTCSGNSQCDNLNACDGVETCDTATHICKAGTAPSCNDNQDCTKDSCEPVKGCLNTKIDLDKDGKSCADDCNDADPTIFAGAPECADGKDNDCDKQTDEAPLTTGKCWKDNDKDSYAPTGAAMISACGCSVGYTNRDPATGADCMDNNANVNPAVTTWYSQAYCKVYTFALPPNPPVCKTWSFDYNCNTVEEKHWTGSSTGCMKIILPGLPPAPPKIGCIGEGWVGAVPECGKDGPFRSCTLSGTFCLASEAVRKQECR